MFGPAGGPPDTYWQPFLGDHFSLAPRDIADLSCEQLMACIDYLEGD